MYKNKTKRNFIITGLLFFLSVLFTLAAKTIDVRAIGPQNSSVGFASINQFVFHLFGVNLIWYDITDWLGVTALLFAFGFAILGFCQLIKRKHLLKVDYHILLLGVFYTLVAAVYLFFECVIINYRPIIMDAALEASYPSSHTMIVICIMTTAMMMFHHLFKNKRYILITADIISILIIGITVIGRLLSGVHWFTDILAGILISSALIMLYYSLVTFTENKVNSGYTKENDGHKDKTF